MRELADDSLPRLDASSHALLAVPRAAAAAAIFAAAWGLGRLLLPRGLARGCRRLERVLTELALGLGALATLPLLLSPFGLLKPASLLILVGIGVALALAGAGRGLASLRRPRLRRPAGTWWLLGVPIAAGAVFALIGALAPEVEYDALWYHLDFPRRYLAAGSLVDLRCEYVSLYPMGTELLFGYGLAFGDAVVAKLLHFGFWALTVAATYDLARRVSAPQRVGLAAAAIVALTPTVLWEATTAYVDLAVTFFATVSLGWVLRFGESHGRGALAVAGLLAGLAVAAKTLGLLAVASLAVLVLAVTAGRARRRVAAMAAFGAIALLPAAPWLGRAWIEGGNPVFPSLYGVFGADADRWTQDAADALDRRLDSWGYRDGVEALLALPWDVTMHAAPFAGSIGVIYLMLVPLAWHRGVGRGPLLLAAFAAVFLVLWASPLSSQQLRFVLPALPALAVLAGLGLARLLALAGRLHPAAAAAAAGLVGLVLVAGLPPFERLHERSGYLVHVLRGAPVDVVTGAETEAEYLARTLPAYASVLDLNRGVGEQERVLALTDPFLDYYAVPELIPDYSVCLVLAGARDGDRASELRALRRLGVRYLLVQPGISSEQGSLEITRRRPPAGFELLHRDSGAVLYRISSRDG